MAQLAKSLPIILAITPPPKPRGRKLQTQSCPAASRARQLNLQLLETADTQQSARQMKDAKADAIVVADYGLLLLPDALVCAPHGALNIHPSLLPKWRGAAPIARAILAGDLETGVCIMQMDEGLDTGAILLRQSIPLSEDKNCGEISAQLATLGAKMIMQTLMQNPPPQAQSTEGIKYARKLTNAENIIDYNQPAQTAARQIRAFAPYRAARTKINGANIGILKAMAITETGNGKNGEILRADNDGIVIKCSDGAIVFLQLRREGKTAQPAAAFLRGFPITPGDIAETIDNNQKPR